MENYVAERYEYETGKRMYEFYQPTVQQEYDKFCKDLSSSNLFFEELTNKYLNEALYLCEVASSFETSVSHLVDSIKKVVLVEPFCDLSKPLPLLEKGREQNDKTGCLIVQGIYPSLTIYLNDFLKYGSFAIGVVGKKHTQSFKIQVSYYKQLHHKLLCQGVSLNPPIRESNNHFEAYILTKKVK